MLGRTHHYYKVRGMADVDYIENAFVYCSEKEYERLPREMKARMGDGRTLKRVRTSGDYRGTLGPFGLAFDAKQFSSERLQLKKLPRHQVEALCSFARPGGLAGFMVYAKQAGTVYWVEARQMRRLCDAALTAAGLKTLNLSWFAQNAVRVCEVRPGDLVEYAETLFATMQP